MDVWYVINIHFDFDIEYVHALMVKDETSSKWKS